jgi:hypothetical protein
MIILFHENIIRYDPKNNNRLQYDIKNEKIKKIVNNLPIINHFFPILIIIKFLLKVNGLIFYLFFMII